MDGGELGKLSPNVLQFGFLLVPRDGDTCSLPGRDTLLQGRVIQPAAQANNSPQFPLLRGSGNELVLERLAERLLIHSGLFCLIGTKPAIV